MAPTRLCVVLTAVLLCAQVRGDELSRADAAYRREDYARAIEIWLPLARSGDARAQFALGNAYYFGHGVESDMAASTRWFRAAAEQGYGPAEFNLGNAYKHGRGVAVDEAQAAAWWRRAAEQHYAVAQFNLALQYHHGLGVPQDPEQALHWMRRAAENGHPRAQAIVASPDASAAHSSGATREEAQLEMARDPPPAIDDEAWVLAQDAGAYTLQLFATADAGRIAPALASHGFAGRVAAFRFERDGQPWFAVIHGVFPDAAAARAAARTLPAGLTEGRPWVRRMSDVQALIRPSERR